MNGCTDEKNSNLYSQPPRLQYTQAGYTLLELLITLAIIAMLSGFIGPNMSGAVERNRKTAAVGDVYNMMSLARSEAVTQHTTIAVCPSKDQQTCSGSAWERGWLIFVDDGAGLGGTAGDGDVNGSEEIIHIGGSAGGTVTVRARNFADLTSISFDDDGLTSDSGTFVICDRSGVSEASAVILGFSGQPRLAVDQNDDGSLERDDGEAVASCL